MAVLSLSGYGSLVRRPRCATVTPKVARRCYADHRNAEHGGELHIPLAFGKPAVNFWGPAHGDFPTWLEPISPAPQAGRVSNQFSADVFALTSLSGAFDGLAHEFEGHLARFHDQTTETPTAYGTMPNADEAAHEYSVTRAQTTAGLTQLLQQMQQLAEALAHQARNIRQIDTDTRSVAGAGI